VTRETSFARPTPSTRDEARRNGERLWAEMGARFQAGRRKDTLPTADQTAGGIRAILPVAEIMRQLMAETEAALRKTTGKLLLP